ncbi:MAG TPA: heme ABC exporter ATP-binding protein CcmA [Vitreimonas sp.]|nr:heme ABC exporter ATP-binding protein CcmA [Vitreimonas sp.]
MAEQEKVGVRVQALAIRRGARLLFEDLSFTSRPGDYLEIRGANGAGKTSLLRAIAGFLRPVAGRVAFDNTEESALALHYVGHLNGLKGGVTPRAHMEYWRGLFGGVGSIDGAASKLGITSLLDLPVRVLSQGQQRRVSLARLLVALRPVWLLDEPAAALDSAGRSVVAQLVSDHCASGGVVLAAVHESLGPSPSQTVVLS